MKIDTKTVTKIAKAFAAYARLQMKAHGKNTVCLCLDNITFVYGTERGERGIRLYVDGSDTPFHLPEMKHSEFAQFTSAVAKEILARLKLSKAWLRKEVEYTVSDEGWQSYRGVKGIILLKPCKKFLALRRKLTALGATFNWDEWRHDRVFGKRSTYSVTDSVFAANQQKTCSSALEFLKGCRKAEVSVVRQNNLEDMEHGERYETEWSGSIDYLLKVSAKGKTRSFYAY